ncbi:MAG: Threonine--tRNA ligase [candidate division WS6 bacterium OLB20]|uniref:Threonine--tRNA ligase n=1 Tax=candidate division WS6 bacterium OLB20 TaxID=1617426 RepID=A0A136M009_9BACT|nr:MAG: Threonine--tRNA ligase [candidate division WS6 bacterium OLB20]
MKNKEYLDNLRHSAAHLLAAAVMELWPETKRTIGPAIDDGFYFDFEFKEPVSAEDMPKIEKRMKKLVTQWNKFERREVSKDEALAEYKGNQYKEELINEFAAEGQTLSFYDSGSYTDLCRGGHVDNPAKELKHFKLLSVAGAYWRGDENKPMLTRIYGTAFATAQELEEFLQRRELARERDHKKLGKELGLFVFSETVGKGLPLWSPKGSTIRRVLERFIVDEEIRRGYLHVYTPDIASLDLYKKSGHYPYYKDSMYAPISIDDEEYMLRPMTCPHHFELYLSEQHSYRELPMRIAELAQLYRYEKSGELMGLQRVRTFCLADAHIICRREQAKEEINGVLDLIDFVCKTLGIEQGNGYSYRLSLGNREDESKYYKNDEAWEEAEGVLRTVLLERNAEFIEAEDEAAFYGPKIDVQMRNVNGKEDTAFTVQYDFVMPGRFNLTFTNEEGEDEQAIVVHRSSIGAIERVMAFLIELYGGAFPVWLSPEQVRIIPISDENVPYAEKLAAQMRSSDIRVSIDADSERMQSKVRKAQTEKIPYMLIVGKNEEAAETVSLRYRSGEEVRDVPFAKFLEQLNLKVSTRLIEPQLDV